MAAINSRHLLSGSRGLARSLAMATLGVGAPWVSILQKEPERKSSCLGPLSWQRAGGVSRWDPPPDALGRGAHPRGRTFS